MCRNFKWKILKTNKLLKHGFVFHFIFNLAWRFFAFSFSLSLLVPFRFFFSLSCVFFTQLRVLLCEYSYASSSFCIHSSLSFSKELLVFPFHIKMCLRFASLTTFQTLFGVFICSYAYRMFFEMLENAMLSMHFSLFPLVGAKNYGPSSWMV